MALAMGQIIKELRKKNGLTQAELAERLGVTFQAVSKWENDTGMPDISQVVPLASIFKVSTDELFGIADTTENDEARKIVQRAGETEKYGELDTYLEAYDILLDGLKKYPGNLIIMVNCMHLGTSLSLPENGWIYAEKRAKEIATETIRQANFIISNSKNISDTLCARQTLVFLYCAQGKFDLAMGEARNFPQRSDFTLYSNMATVNEYTKDYNQTAKCLCSNIDYTLQALENDIARFGKTYYNAGRYEEAISVYEAFFEMMRAVFQNEFPLPYHDFDSGDCYMLLAEAYLAIGEASKAMDAVEKSMMYYIDLYNAHLEETILMRKSLKSPLLSGTEVFTSVPRNIIKSKLLHKLDEYEIGALKQDSRLVELMTLVNNLP